MKMSRDTIRERDSDLMFLLTSNCDKGISVQIEVMLRGNLLTTHLAILPGPDCFHPDLFLCLAVFSFTLLLLRGIINI